MKPRTATALFLACFAAACAAVLIALALTGCRTLYRENSPQREREHEFFEHHMDNLSRGH